MSDRFRNPRRTRGIGAMQPPGCAPIHLNTVRVVLRGSIETDPSSDEQESLALMERYRDDGIGYRLSKPSPAGQAAWSYQKLQGWSDCPDGPEALFGMDAMLDNAMPYWLPNAYASSSRLYWENLGDAAVTKPIGVPVDINVFPRDINRSPRRWTEPLLRNTIHWNKIVQSEHFGAFEQPELFVQKLCACFSRIR